MAKPSGRSPKPAAMKRLDGNPSRRPIIEAEVVASGLVFVPDHLSEDATLCIETVKRSMPPSVYATVDSYGLSAFATAWAWHKRATHEMNAPGFSPVVSGSTGQAAPNPWFKILRLASEEMRAWGDRLGLDPAARARLRLPNENDKPASKFGGLIGLPGSSRSLNA